MDSESVEFNDFFKNGQDGTIDEKQRQVLREKSSIYNMGMQKFGSRGFDDDGVSQLFLHNKESENYNETQILKLQKNNSSKIVKITGVNSVGAQTIFERQANNLPNQTFLCLGSKVFLTKNLKLYQVLVIRMAEERIQILMKILVMF